MKNGENTLQWPPLGCHIVTLYYFPKNVHVWMYPTSNFWKNFILLLHIMLGYNLNKILEKETISFHFIMWEIGVYSVPMYSKTQIYFKNNLNKS